jgi:hypothetical protein
MALSKEPTSRRSSPSKAEGRISRCQHEEALEMPNLLFTASSLLGDGSRSRQIASEFIDRWRSPSQHDRFR